MAKECTCARKSFLHVTGCPVIEQRVKLALFQLEEDAFSFPNSVIFYVANDEVGALAQLERFRKNIKDEDWMFQIGTGAVNTITMSNGTEITFMPESEALDITSLPNSHTIFLEASNATRDLSELLLPITGSIMVIDPQTKELL